ncbi:MAG: hypothetical protein DRQ10_07645 [Candidatus Hydrothermota bacterium]|nr:MAG: hypothetical protein DRQ10_07645 [Candidatus Hydrothermae bacterium]
MKLGVFFGCTTRSNPELMEPLVEFLEKAGVEYERLGTELCCGAPLLLAGYVDEAKVQAEKVRKDIESKGVELVVTPCPHCYVNLKHEHEKLLGTPAPYEVKHLSQFIHDLIKSGQIKLTKPIPKKFTFHDPCYLGRQGDGIYDEPRFVVQSVPEVEFEELPFNRENATCCGGGGLLRAFLPKLSSEVSAEKIRNEVIPIGVNAVATSCPFCYTNLKEGAAGTDIEVYDLVKLVLEAME